YAAMRSSMAWVKATGETSFALSRPAISVRVLVQSSATVAIPHSSFVCPLALFRKSCQLSARRGRRTLGQPPPTGLRSRCPCERSKAIVARTPRVLRRLALLALTASSLLLLSASRVLSHGPKDGGLPLRPVRGPFARCAYASMESTCW